MKRPTVREPWKANEKEMEGLAKKIRGTKFKVPPRKKIKNYSAYVIVLPATFLLE